MHLPDDQPKFDLHPDRLRALAILFHLSIPARVDQAYVTVLGVSHGANVLALACEYPRAKITAVVTESEHLTALKKILKDLNINNVRVMTCEHWLNHTPKSQANYVICHGYYSYLNSDEKQRLNAHIAQIIHPEGLIYIDYVVQPGWQVFASLQHLLVQTSSENTLEHLDEEQFNHNINLIYKYLPESSPLRHSINHIVPQMTLRTHPSLHGYWALKPAHAETVDVFINRLHEHQLGYVCDSDIARYYFTPLPHEIQEHCGHNFHLRENMYDLMFEQSSRASLIAPASQLLGFRLPQREAMLQRLDDLHISGGFILIDNQTLWQSTLNPRITVSATTFNSLLMESINRVYQAHSTLAISKLLEIILLKFKLLEDIEEYARVLILDLILSGALHLRSQRQNGFKHQASMLALHEWRLEHDPYLTPADKWLHPLSEQAIETLQIAESHT